MRMTSIVERAFVGAGLLAMLALAACEQTPQQAAQPSCYSGASAQAAERNPSCEGGIVAPAPGR